MHSLFSNNETLCKLPLHEIKENFCTETHPKINIGEEILNQPRACRINSTYDVTTNSSKFFKTLSQHCYRGLIFLRWLKFFQKFFCNLRQRILPKKPKFSLSIDDYIETRNWSTGSICCMTWHPHLFKLAIASTDNIVRLYTDQGIVQPLLKHESQKSITCLAWRPCALEDLALGCIKGIIVWFSDTSKTKLLYPKLLTYEGHFPVTSLAWNADGLLLASCSPNDSNILLWNVDNSENTPLRRFGPNCILLRWSAPTAQLFCATINTTFRIWKLKEFCDAERWNLNSGRIKSACWSPCGKILLFVNSDHARIFCFKQLTTSPFQKITKKWEAFPIVDLSALEINNQFIGGIPQSIVWDMCGIFVGITFRESNCVAVFFTKIESERLSIIPYGFVAGINEEFPQCICFQSCNRFSQNVVLTIGWSSGRIEFCLLSGGV